MEINKRILGLIISIIMIMSFTNNIYAADYYWVGGSGNWSSFAGHWATSSGGTTYYAAVPSAADTVIFDANSGFTATSKTITINVNAICGDFRISGVGIPPTINNSGGSTFSVFGSMQLQVGTVFNASTVFRPIGPQTLQTNGVALNAVTIDGAGTLTLSGNSKFGNFSLLNGTFDTANFRLDVANLSSNTSSPKVLKLGSSLVYVSGNANFYGTNLNFQAGTSHIHFTGNINLDASGGNGGLISTTTISLYDVTFDFVNPTLAGINSYSGAGLNFHNLTFNGNSAIRNAGIAVDNLILKTNKSLTLTSGKGYTIRQSLTIGTSSDGCAAYSILETNTKGSQATITMQAGAVANVYHTLISDIKIVSTPSSGTVIPLLNSYDKGNNTGWTFTPTAAKIYYWVGGAGNWSDLSHWRIDNGAGVKIAATCLPSLDDNVIFDNSSGFTAAGQVVNLNVQGLVHNISFLGTSNPPSLNPSSVSNDLTITGSSILQTGMLFTAVTDYASKGPQTITSNGVRHDNLVTFSGRTVSDIVKLNDGFNTISNITHVGGTFNTNGQPVTAYNYISSSANPRRLQLSNSTFTINGDTFVTAGSPIMIVDPNTSTINFNRATINGLDTSLIVDASHAFYNVNFNTNFLRGVVQRGTYNTITFNGSGTLTGSSTIRTNTLNFTSGKSYSLSGWTSVTTAFNAVGANCSSTIAITGTANLMFGSAAVVNVTFAVISRMNVSRVSGTLPIVADSSTDVVGNSGWTFTASGTGPRILYWVGAGGNWNDVSHWSLTSGGAGGECPPKETDNVFFDAGSNFTAASRIVNLNVAGTVHNFTVQNAGAAPAFAGNTLSLYGSMILQNGTTYNISTDVFPAIGNTETLTTNGVVIGGSTFNLRADDRTGTFKLLDNARFSSSIGLVTGIFDLNGKNIVVAKITDGVGGNGTNGIRIFRAGNSKISITDSGVSFLASSTGTVFEFGSSSVIDFTGNDGAIYAPIGVAFNEVIFSNTNSSIAGIRAGSSTFKIANFKGGGEIRSTNNVFGILSLTAGKTYTFLAGAEQIITEEFYASGNSCRTLTIKSTVAGTQTSLNVQNGDTDYSYALVTDINATGKGMVFDVNSSNGGNNTNIVFRLDGENGIFKGQIIGLGPDMLCNIIDPAVPSTYTLDASGFFGNLDTTYKWTKVSGSPSVSGTLGTGETLDITATGYGVYRVDVEYGNCPATDQITVSEGTIPPMAAPQQILCGTVYDISKIDVAGTAVKFYGNQTTTTVLPPSTSLVNGSTYYASQTVNNNCESDRVPIKVIFDNCSFANPSLRSKGGNN